VEALSRQAATLGFYSNSVINRLQEQVAERMGIISGYGDYSLFMVNSGAEANENAFKLASFHTGRSRILSLKKAFHGRTSLAVEATDNPKIIAPVNDSGHVTYLPWNDLEAARNELSKNDVAALIIEGIQGVGGIRVPSDEYMRGLREACTAHGTVLILDEIQSGYGRSGRFFAHQYSGIRPDLITVAKGIANGFPCGALLISSMFEPVLGQLGTTFGGNHLACAAALAVMDVIEQEKLVENAASVGSYLLEQLSSIPGPAEVRGRGLMIGIEFDEPVKEIRQRLLFEKHIFTGVSSNNVIRLLPPLCITGQDADRFLESYSQVLKTK
jgi:acetylornithine aminotransferase